MVSLGFIIVLILVAIFAPLVVKLVGVSGPNQQNLNSLDAFGQPLGPTSAHPFGVDELGRDILARTIYGARISLEVAFIATGIAVLVGTIVGTAARLLPRLDRLSARAPDGHRPGLPDPVACDRPRVCVLAGQGLPRRPDHAGRTDADRRDRAVVLAVHRAHRSRSGAVAPREGVHRRGPVAWCVGRPGTCERRFCPTSLLRSLSTRHWSYRPMFSTRRHFRSWAWGSSRRRQAGVR